MTRLGYQIPNFTFPGGDVEIVEMILSSGVSAIAVRDFEVLDGLRVAAVRRDGETLIPTSSFLLEEGDMVVAAASMLGPVGVDVESHRPRPSFDALAAFAFGPRERDIARRSPEAFYRIWCLREAMSKATGRGLNEQ